MQSSDRISYIRRLISVEYGDESLLEKATDKDIAVLEEQLGYQLPSEYKRFVKEIGGVFEAPGFEHASVRHASAELANTRDPDERKHFSTFAPHLLPIGGDLDQYYCLVCSGEDCGKVVSWRPRVCGEERQPGSRSEDPDCQLVADSFLAWVAECLVNQIVSHRKWLHWLD